MNQFDDPIKGKVEVSTGGNIALNGYVKGGNISINALNTFTHDGPKAYSILQANDTLTLHAKEIDIDVGLNAGWLEVNGNSLHNNAGVTTAAGMEITLTKDLHNHGQIQTAGDVNLTVEKLYNNGQISGNTLRIVGNEWDNVGTTQSKTAILTNKMYNINNQGTLKSPGVISLNDSQLNNTGQLLFDAPLTASDAQQ